MSNNQAISGDGRYMTLTRDIRVLVDPAYLEDRFDPEASQYVWAYTIEIRNEGSQSVQLKERYWEITDANCKVEHVKGTCVVGEQPTIRLGEAYEYISGCPLEPIRDSWWDAIPCGRNRTSPSTLPFRSLRWICQASIAW